MNKSPVSILLLFDSEEDKQKWAGWYIDGGGEQQSNYDAVDGSDWDNFNYIKLELLEEEDL